MWRSADVGVRLSGQVSSYSLFYAIRGVCAKSTIYMETKQESVRSIRALLMREYLHLQDLPLLCQFSPASF